MSYHLPKNVLIKWAFYITEIFGLIQENIFSNIFSAENSRQWQAQRLKRGNSNLFMNRSKDIFPNTSKCHHTNIVRAEEHVNFRNRAPLVFHSLLPSHHFLSSYPHSLLLFHEILSPPHLFSISFDLKLVHPYKDKKIMVYSSS